MNCPYCVSFSNQIYNEEGPTTTVQFRQHTVTATAKVTTAITSTNNKNNYNNKVIFLKCMNVSV